jgi:hypothetical protein
MIAERTSIVLVKIPLCIEKSLWLSCSTVTVSNVSTYGIPRSIPVIEWFLAFRWNKTKKMPPNVKTIGGISIVLSSAH